MKTREQNRSNKRTAIEQFDWFIERVQKSVASGWLKGKLGWKYFMPENFPEIKRYFALTSCCNRIGKSNNAFSTLGILWRENKESMFWSFHPLAVKTNNEQLPKPYFKFIRKSLYDQQARETNETETKSQGVGKDFTKVIFRVCTYTDVLFLGRPHILIDCLKRHQAQKRLPEGN